MSRPTPISAEFEPLLELGSGGMGTVYLARTTGIAGFERLVALKRMHPELLEREDLMSRFVDEARLSAYVRHANVVAVHQLGRDEQGFYLVLDYVEGASLDSLVQGCTDSGGRIPPPIVLRIIADALAGLHAVHEATDPVGSPLSILHRDISTNNILVGRDGVARLTDFGVARSALAAQRTEAHRLLGKLLYLPPEYLRQETIDRRLDVYAMGVTLWIALAGVEPWPETTEADLVKKIVYKGVPPLATSGLNVAEGIESVIRCACARRPDDRFPTALAMSVELERLARETGWMASHSEVAEFVEQLEGVRMNSVRQSIASQISSSSNQPPLRTSDPEPMPETEVALQSVPVPNPRVRTRSGTTSKLPQSSPAPVVPVSSASPRSLGHRRTALGLGTVGAPQSSPAPSHPPNRRSLGPKETKLGLGTPDPPVVVRDSMVDAIPASSPMSAPILTSRSAQSPLAQSEPPSAKGERWKVIAIVAFIVIALLVGILIGILGR